MRVLLVIASALIAVNAYTVDEIEQEWADFKAKEGKRYYNYDEEVYRKQVFIENLQYIEEQNKKFDQGLVSFTVGINKFADLTHDEYVQMFTLFNQTEAPVGMPFVPPTNLKVSNAMDWRNMGAVTHVKNQQACGSCWAFGATGALEGAFFRKYGRLVSLSEQNLVDCSTQNGGCTGGLPTLAFEHVKNYGINPEQSYPYEGRQGTCRYNPQNSVGRVSGYGTIQQGSERDLKAAVDTIGPIALGIDASLESFKSYRGGIYDDPECSSVNLGHAVLVVGYGTTYDGKDYWIVKNSYGPRFGEGGYILIARNKNNQCGIASMASYPIAA